MDIEFSCPDCDQKIECDSPLSDTEVECPTCSCLILVPSSEDHSEKEEEEEETSEIPLCGAMEFGFALLFFIGAVTLTVYFADQLNQQFQSGEVLMSNTYVDDGSTGKRNFFGTEFEFDGKPYALKSDHPTYWVDYIMKISGILFMLAITGVALWSVYRAGREWIFGKKLPPVDFSRLKRILDASFTHGRK